MTKSQSVDRKTKPVASSGVSIHETSVIFEVPVSHDGRSSNKWPSRFCQSPKDEDHTGESVSAAKS
jgi:hypothetical protein